MYHSVTFGNKNSYNEWRLVPSSRPVINPPKPKVQYVDIPGADGSIDLTESLAGRPVFEDREGSLEFIVLNDFNVDNYQYNWIDVYTSIMQYLHGQRMTMVLDDEPDYFYEGRFTVNSWKSDQNNSTITIDYRLSPYKYPVLTRFTEEDLTIGALVYNESTHVISEVTSDKACAMTKASSIRPYSAGDSIRVDSKFRFDVAMYSGTAENPVGKDFAWHAHMIDNRYTFADNGFYRLNIYTANRYIPVPLTDADLVRMAAAIHYFSGGVL